MLAGFGRLMMLAGGLWRLVVLAGFRPFFLQTVTCRLETRLIPKTVLRYVGLCTLFAAQVFPFFGRILHKILETL